MRAGLVIGAAVAAAVAGAAVATKTAHRRAERIRTAADPYPYDTLRRDPVGEERVVERPDGTRIAVVVAGDGPTVVLAHGFAVTMVEWNVVWERRAQPGDIILLHAGLYKSDRLNYVDPQMTPFDGTMSLTAFED